MLVLARLHLGPSNSIIHLFICSIICFLPLSVMSLRSDMYSPEQLSVQSLDLTVSVQTITQSNNRNIYSCLSRAHHICAHGVACGLLGQLFFGASLQRLYVPRQPLQLYYDTWKVVLLQWTTCAVGWTQYMWRGYPLETPWGVCLASSEGGCQACGPK